MYGRGKISCLANDLTVENNKVDQAGQYMRVLYSLAQCMRERGKEPIPYAPLLNWSKTDRKKNIFLVPSRERARAI